MSLFAVEAVLRKLRNVSQDDISNICNSIEDLMLVPERSNECTMMLRQLFVMLQASESKLWWLSKKDFDIQMKAFSFIVAVSSLHGIISQDIVSETSEQLCNWLMNASVFQSPNPYTLNPFRKDASSQVTEIDGTPCRNVFTILNVGQYYTDDQFMNIYSFSLLYKWLYHCTHSSLKSDDKSALGEDATTRRLQGVSRVLQSLVSRSVDYCFRVMDQCERKAKVSSDGELQLACLMEVVVILDLVCKLDAGHLPRVHQEMRRLYTRLMSDLVNIPTVLRILQFFINHSASVVHDPQEIYNHFFNSLLPDHFGNPGLAFDTVVFLVNNLATICYNTNIFSRFFPSILKVLAWHPQTFLKEFVSLLPAMMYPVTALEVFHTLLDLPCVTAALEVMEKAKKSEAPITQGANVEPVSSIEAFHTPARYRPLFSFITRNESGQGDTINKLSSLHKVLEDMRSSARVVYCSQTIPLLLKVWFDVVLEDAEEDFAGQLLPVMLERSGLLFDLPDFKADVIMLLGEKLLLLLKKFPAVLMNQATDIMEFIYITSNIYGRQDFYGNLVYAVGEYSSPMHAPNCSPELVAQYFDALEVVTYEIIGKVLLEEEGVSPKILCHLMSAMAKLSTRCQDLIPRAILCLTKVAKQHYTLTQDSLAQEALVSCAQEHINLLQNPNFAVAILSPSPEIYTGRWHRDKFSLPMIVRGMHRIMVMSSSQRG
ncbi:hypothetical protein C0Q70_00734 [Pomacea canaliculata]|uniref:Uncharacterized protein n=1 Tax=Pomacea canaliculata TaxID=400727 RepID=A0A2T7PXG7_POMCA|nr:hypothetical protein C0Q70_00734 [Pomacea canaliculata]